MVTTNDKKIADKIRLLSKMGINKDPWIRKIIQINGNMRLMN